MSCLKLCAQIGMFTFCVLMVSGCVVISRDHKISRVRVYPKVEEKPSVYIEGYQQRITEDGASRFSIYGPNKEGMCKELGMLFSWSGLFSNVTLVNANADYTVNFEENLQFTCTSGSRGWSLITLGLIPCTEDRSYEWVAHIKNNKTGEVRTARLEEKARSWRHILFSPVALCTGSWVEGDAISVDFRFNMPVAVHEAIVNWESEGNIDKPKTNKTGLNVEGKPTGSVQEDALVKKLSILKSARDAEVITEQEYQKKRAELLKGL